MKWILTVIGGLLILMGIVWILQGINVLPGSFMTGKLQYAILGFVVDVGGIFLVLFANRPMNKNK